LWNCTRQRILRALLIVQLPRRAEVLVTLAPGVVVSHYRIVDKIGEGGMGVVWRALDTSLGREVALKVLPERLAHDPERLARFEREAKLLASINHPNIAAIYQLEHADGVRFLAMELTGGVDLATRLARERLDIRDALRIARDVADALEAAHERGIVHRDLKPSNIMVGTGTDHASSVDAARAKVLDFGLAKAVDGDGGPVEGADIHRSQSPTLTGMMTGANVILGTAAYMSPEQARGQLADKRADVWAFGVVLYEMLAGKQLFEGETISDTLASVLKNEVNWSALPKETPARVRTLLRRCIERDRRARLRDIGEARIVLDDVLAGKPDSHVLENAGSGQRLAGLAWSHPRTWIPLAAALAVGAALAVAFLGTPGRGTPKSGELRKLILGADAGGTMRPRVPAISPDGRAVAYAAGSAVVIRRLDAVEPRVIDVGGNVDRVFWSPDGKQVGFVMLSRVGRIDPGSGVVQTIHESKKAFTGGTGATWRTDGTIVVSRGDSDGLIAVSSASGDAHTILAPDSTKEHDFHEPYAIDGGKNVLFVPHETAGPFDTIELWDGKTRRTLVSMEGQTLGGPVYSPSGHILFTRAPTNPGIWAVPFSLAKLEVTGDPFLVAVGGTNPSVSADGTLAYREGSGVSGRRLVLADRQGRETGEIAKLPSGAMWWFAMSHDFKRAAFPILEAGESDLWVADVTRATRTRLTFDQGHESFPSWSPRGDRVVYETAPASAEANQVWLEVVAADGASGKDSLTMGLTPSFTPDGTGIVFSSIPAGGTVTDADLCVFSFADRTVRKLFAAPRGQYGGTVSPNGRWIAYASDESGRYEVYLRPYPSGDGRWQVSAGGGVHPRWNTSGDRLFFAFDAEIYEVELGSGTTPTLGRPNLLFRRPLPNNSRPAGLGHDFAVSGDGQQFAYYVPPGDVQARSDIVIVENWSAEFARTATIAAGAR
jgi:Tol biopolymer transport system component